MSRTLSFARLDYLTIKPYLTLKSIALLLIVIAFVSFGTGESSMLIGMLMMYGTIYASYPFAVGEKNGIDTLYATLPLKKGNIVAGRYIFAIFLNISTGAIAFAVSAILMPVLKKGFNWKEILITVLICLFIFSVLEAIQLPIYFKLGYAKAKFLAYLPLAVFPAAVIAISVVAGKENSLEFLNNVFLWAEGNVLFTVTIAVALWMLLLLSSGLLSYRFYKSRQF